MEVNLTVGKLSSSRMVPLAVAWDIPARVGLLMVTVKVSSPSYLLLVSLWPSSKVGTVMVVDELPAVMVPVPDVGVKSFSFRVVVRLPAGGVVEGDVLFGQIAYEKHSELDGLALSCGGVEDAEVWLGLVVDDGAGGG